MSQPSSRIDCDIHPALPSTAALVPYLEPHWAEQVVSRGIDGLDLSSTPPFMALNGRPDWRPPSGEKPGSSLPMLRKQALDGFGSSIAICNCLYGAQAVYSEDLAAALCRAINDWLAEEWLAKEPRLRASIVVPMQSPKFAVEEIERRASDPRFVQVLVLAMGETLLGRRHFWPVYEAAERHGLPIGIHAGGQYRNPPSSVGWPSYRVEYYVAEAQAFQSQLLSLIYEGVFKKYPGLRVVLMESGITWLPAFMWRATKTWRGLRVEVPWVDRSPAELIRQHVRLTTQPFDGPPDTAKVERVMEQIGSDRMFLFSTDYPHWQFDGDDAIPAGFSQELVRKMCVENPQETYPRLKELVQ
jgi:predicted TIM-barrel fold metal-dependent hydrolase